ncbi:hypothetical protein ACFYNO_03005 [Kitasatospora sp. NPDC006697]|uniref:hypothetical protein n=1 Tax=Kitasatospora sp. NPDC006697 TaxID=3364020 RepID=UPI0036760481
MGAQLMEKPAKARKPRTAAPAARSRKAEPRPVEKAEPVTVAAPVEREAAEEAEPLGSGSAEPDYAIKVSVSMPGSVVEDIKARVGKRGFSRYVTEAVERRIALDKLGELVGDYLAENGPFSEAVTREVEQEWREAMGLG